MPAPGECEHPAQLTRCDPLICGYLNQPHSFLAQNRASGPTRCLQETARAEIARVCAADFECVHPAQVKGSDHIIRGYLDKATAFSGSDWCVETAKMPLKDGPSILNPPRETEKLISNVSNLLSSAEAKP